MTGQRLETFDLICSCYLFLFLILFVPVICSCFFNEKMFLRPWGMLVKILFFLFIFVAILVVDKDKLFFWRVVRW